MHRVKRLPYADVDTNHVRGCGPFTTLSCRMGNHYLRTLKLVRSMTYGKIDFNIPLAVLFPFVVIVLKNILVFIKPPP